MIPLLPEGMTLEQEIEYYDALYARLSSQSEVHLRWFTHRGNPSICWICDLITINSKLVALLTKSTSRLGEHAQAKNQDNVPEYEIEEDLNYNEEEYQIE